MFKNYKKVIAGFILATLSLTHNVFADDSGGDDSTDETKKYESYYIDAYESSLAVLNEAIANNASQEDIAALTEAMNNAFSDLQSFCESHGYGLIAEAGKEYVNIDHKDGTPNTIVGDPVRLSDGSYVLEEEDLSISVGKNTFSVKRKLNSRLSNANLEGAFGGGWASNIDSRVIYGYSKAAVDKYYSLKRTYDELLQKQKTTLQDLETARFEIIDSLYQEYKDNVLHSLDSYKDALSELRESVYIEEKNQKVLYGKLGEFATKIGHDYLIYVDDEGTAIVCKKNGSTFVPVNSSYKNRIKIVSDYYENDDDETPSTLVTIDNKEKRLFDNYGCIKKIESISGNRKIVFSSSNGRVTKAFVYDGNLSSRSISFKWNGNRIESISDGIKTTKYSYTNNVLSSVTDWEQDTKKYSYDSVGRVEKLYKPDGSCITIGYSGNDANAKVSFTQDENGSKEYFNYSSYNTNYFDKDGNKSSFNYTSNGLTTKQTFPDGTSYSFEYNENALMSRSIGNFETIDYSYDEKGNIVCAEYSDGSTKEWVYDDDKVVSIKDRDDYITEFSYDDYGNLTARYIQGELAAKIDYVNGKISSFTDLFGNITKYKCDSFGAIIEKAVYEKNQTKPSSIEKWTYDKIGRIVSYTNSLGVIHSYTYEPHKTTITSSDGMKRILSYSNRKLLVSDKTIDTKTNRYREYSYEYDKTRNLSASYVSGVDSSGIEIPKTLLETFSYTKDGRLSKKTVWNSFDKKHNAGFTSSFSYSNGMLLGYEEGILTSDNTISPESRIWMNQSYSFESDGKTFRNVVGKNGESGIETVLKFDGENRLLSKIVDDIVIQESEYSSEGRMLNMRKNDSGIYDISYNDFGFIEGISERNGVKNAYTKTEYFLNGKKSSFTTRGGFKTEYGYDCFGNVSYVKNDRAEISIKRDGSGRVLSKVVQSNGKTLYEESFQYDDKNRKVIHKVNDSIVETFELSSFGEVLSKTDGEGNKTTYSYDILGRIVSETNAYGNKTLYEWDSSNNLIRTTYPNGNFIQREYDYSGNCVRVFDSVGDIMRATYDVNGNVLSFDERPFSSPTFYSYDGAGRVTCVTKNNVVIESYEYDESKIITRTDSKGNQTVYNLDGFGNLLSQTNRLGNFSFVKYDVDGEIKEIVDFNGRKTSIKRANNGCWKSKSDGETEYFVEYDGLNRVICAKNGNHKLEYEYDKFGNVSSVYDSSLDSIFGSRIKYSYNKNNLVTNINGCNRNISYQYGKNNELVRLVDVVKTNGTDSITEVNFAYDKCGREVRRVWNSGERLDSVYDSAGRLILKVGYTALNNVAFVEGRVYDENGRLSLLLDSNMCVTKYVYDSNGRIQKVFYPNSDSIVKHFIDLSEEAGIHSLYDVEAERLSISSSEYESLQTLCRKISNGTLSVSSNLSVVCESFIYDTEGNIIERKIPFGSIKYAYDSENRLVNFGSTLSNESNVVFSYDKNGNLTKKVTLIENSVFSYNSDNRISNATVTKNGETTTSSYEYDYFGRRIKSGNSKTIYDRFSLNELYITASYEKENNTSYSTRNSYKSSENTNVVTDGRYFWINEEKNQGSSRSDTSSYSDLAPLYANENTPLSFTSLGSESFSGISKNVLMNDSIGSVKSSINDDGTVSNYVYDIFGNSKDNLTFGFVGKRLDIVSNSYNFGYRDYLSNTGRFTTIDPILDGTNWYSYCAGDPVNYVDWDGYKATTYSNGDVQQNHSGEYTGNSKEDMAKTGCTIVAGSNAVSGVKDSKVTADDINSNKSNFMPNDGRISWNDFCNNYGVDRGSVERSNFNSNEEFENFIFDLINSDKEYALIVEGWWNAEHGSHFYGLDGSTKTKDGETYFGVIPSSKYDQPNSLGSGRVELGYFAEEGKTYAPSSAIQRVDYFSDRDSPKTNNNNNCSK